MIPIESRLTHIKLLAQVQLNYISDFKADFKDRNFFTGAFKSFLNNLIIKLSEIEEKHFDHAINKEERATEECYAVLDNYLKTMSSVPIWDMANIETIINAYNINPKAIEGIVKKILK